MKKTIQIILFSLILGGVLLCSYSILSWKDTSGEYKSSVKQLEATDNNLIDVVFVGSSHVYNGIAPHVLWSNYGIPAFDMSISGMDKDSELYYTKELLKTQSPKTICVDIYSLYFDEHLDQGNVYRNLLSMRLGKNSYDMAKAYLQGENIADYLLRWPIIHTRYKEIKKEDYLANGFSIFARGEALSYTTRSVEYFDGVDYDAVGTLSDRNKRWIDDFIELSEKNNFELIFFTTPFIPDNGAVQVYNAAKEYIESRGFRYINGINEDSISLDLDKDFCDMGHLNNKGAEKYTLWLADKLFETGDYDNRLQDSRYALWNQDAMHYFYETICVYIDMYLETDSYAEASELIREYSDFSYVFYLNSDVEDPLIFQLLHDLDLEEQIAIGECVVVGKGDEAYLYLNGENSKTAYYSFSRYDCIKMSTDIDGNVKEYKFNLDNLLSEEGNNLLIWSDNDARIVYRR